MVQSIVSANDIFIATMAIGKMAANFQDAKKMMVISCNVKCFLVEFQTELKVMKFALIKKVLVQTKQIDILLQKISFSDSSLNLLMF